MPVCIYDGVPVDAGPANRENLAPTVNQTQIAASKLSKVLHIAGGGVEASASSSVCPLWPRHWPRLCSPEGNTNRSARHPQGLGPKIASNHANGRNDSRLRRRRRSNDHLDGADHPHSRSPRTESHRFLPGPKARPRRRPSDRLSNSRSFQPGNRGSPSPASRRPLQRKIMGAAKTAPAIAGAEAAATGVEHVAPTPTATLSDPQRHSEAGGVTLGAKRAPRRHFIQRAR